MHTRFYIIAGLAVVLSFVGGFLLANSLNKGEIATLQEKRTVPENQPKAGSVELADKEIQEKLSEARENPKNFGFQKNLGIALYRYAASKKDTDLLSEVEQLLERANGLNPDDYEVLVSYANISFDLGQLKKDPGRIQKARTLYTKALEKNPKDSSVMADLGFTYLGTEDPEPLKAIERLESAHEIDPKNERVVTSLSLAYLKVKNPSKSSEYLAKLKQINPQNADIPQIENELQSEATQ